MVTATKTATIVKAVSVIDNVLSIEIGESMDFTESNPVSVRNIVFQRVLDKFPSRVYSTTMSEAGTMIVKREKDITRSERQRIEAGELRKIVLKDRKLKKQ